MSCVTHPKTCVTRLTFRTVAAYPYKQCRPLHGRAPGVSALLELRDATESAVTQLTANSLNLQPTKVSQLPEIPASAYTSEMEILGVIPDIPTFDGEPVPVSRNPLTSRTRPLQLLPLSGTEFPIHYETSRMRSFQTEVDLGKARTGGSSTDASAFWDLLDPSMLARVVAAGFDRYARSSVGPLSAWCDHPDPVHCVGMLIIRGRLSLLGREDQDEAGGMERVANGGPTCCPGLYSRGEGPGRSVGSFDWATLALAHLYHGLDVWTRGSGESNWQFIRPLEVWAYEYRIYPRGPSGDTPAESRRIPRYLAHCHHTYASTEDPEYWRSFLNDRALSDLLLTPWEGEAWRTYPGREVAELYTRSRLLLQGYWLDRYFLGERVYDIQAAPAQRRVPHAPPRHMCLLEGMTA
ncbi:hypothetical protein JCGZ_01770 [Jatropha curcas]|uniref:Aminotransferase-like plant mobile domain-containing protein n=1 Tax=Jatropha curcas TaxID=180498 RepID=A0A067JSK0_JATCU|nr:hypothetical protein JCGZ_01770 [Jatropha curcas]